MSKRRQPRRNNMGARDKLNHAYGQGAVLFAAAVGYACGSWTIFLLAGVALVVMAVQKGDIR